MALLQQIEKDYEQVYKQKKTNEISTLRMLLSALKYAKIAKKEDLDDDEVIKIIKSEIKKRNEAIEQYEQAQRQELADKEKSELEILNKYLPAQMSEDQVSQVIDQVISQMDDTENFGAVMGQVMAQLKGQADGGLVKKLVEQKLAK